MHQDEIVTTKIGTNEHGNKTLLVMVDDCS